MFMFSVCEVLRAHLCLTASSSPKLNWQFLLIFESKTNCNGDPFCTNSSYIYRKQIFEYQTNWNSDPLVVIPIKFIVTVSKFSFNCRNVDFFNLGLSSITKLIFSSDLNFYSVSQIT